MDLLNVGVAAGGRLHSVLSSAYRIMIRCISAKGACHVLSCKGNLQNQSAAAFFLFLCGCRLPAGSAAAFCRLVISRTVVIIAETTNSDHLQCQHAVRVSTQRGQVQSSPSTRKARRWSTLQPLSTFTVQGTYYGVVLGGHCYWELQLSWCSTG